MSCTPCSRRLSNCLDLINRTPQARHRAASFQLVARSRRNINSSTPRAHRASIPRRNEPDLASSDAGLNDGYIPFDLSILKQQPPLPLATASTQSSQPLHANRIAQKAPRAASDADYEAFDLNGFEPEIQLKTPLNHEGLALGENATPAGVSRKPKGVDIRRARNRMANRESNDQIKTASRQLLKVSKATQEEATQVVDRLLGRSMDRRITHGSLGSAKRAADDRGSVSKGRRGEQKHESTQKIARRMSEQAPTTGGVQANEAVIAQRQLKREPWQVQKAALKQKLNGERWNPRKKVSPDAMEGIRALNAQYPTHFTTAVLANQFEVSPEAIRRILKSKWRPNGVEEEDRNERWEKRGQKIWTTLAERGVHPPAKWRSVGIGSGSRKMVEEGRWTRSQTPVSAHGASGRGSKTDRRERWIQSLEGRDI